MPRNFSQMQRRPQINLQMSGEILFPFGVLKFAKSPSHLSFDSSVGGANRKNTVFL